MKGFGTLKGALKESTNLCPECFNGSVVLDNSFTVSEMIHIIELHNLCFSLNLRVATRRGRFISQQMLAGGFSKPERRVLSYIIRIISI